jgi:hypothetical protein
MSAPVPKTSTAPERFAYYARLSRADKATYRKSDEARLEGLEAVEALRAEVERLGAALERGDGRRIGASARRFAAGVTTALGAPPVRVRVRRARPSSETEELHGLYEEVEGEAPVITVWSRTAVHQRPVALRTFVRTLIHELCHHLDYTVLGLEESFHTRGFYGREAAISRVVLPPAPRRAEQLGLWEAA